MNWWLHFFNIDPVHLIGACKRVTVSVRRNVTVSNAETNFKYSYNGTKQIAYISIPSSGNGEIYYIG